VQLVLRLYGIGGGHAGFRFLFPLCSAIWQWLQLAIIVKGFCKGLPISRTIR